MIKLGASIMVYTHHIWNGISTPTPPHPYAGQILLRFFSVAFLTSRLDTRGDPGHRKGSRIWQGRGKLPGEVCGQTMVDVFNDDDFFLFAFSKFFICNFVPRKKVIQMKFNVLMARVSTLVVFFNLQKSKHFG